jgi:hypothetical protein
MGLSEIGMDSSGSGKGPVEGWDLVNTVMNLWVS